MGPSPQLQATLERMLVVAVCPWCPFCSVGLYLCIVHGARRQQPGGQTTSRVVLKTAVTAWGWARSQWPVCPGLLPRQGSFSGAVITELRPQRREGASLEKARRLSQEACKASKEAPG